MYKVKTLKKAEKGMRKLPLEVCQKYKALVLDLEASGPEQPEWRNYSKLDKSRYHCHLNYHYIACWTYENEILTVEVYYVGSRENAPY